MVSIPNKTLKERASGLVVMTSRLQRGDRLFNSGLAHSSYFTVCFLATISRLVE
jgi:hypothetical protein